MRVSALTAGLLVASAIGHADQAATPSEALERIDRDLPDWLRGLAYYSGKVLEVRDQSARVMAWMRPVHQGSLGSVWKFLVFLSGLVPALFVTTGIIMWAKKRKRRVPMTALTDDVTADEVPA